MRSRTVPGLCLLLGAIVLVPAGASAAGPAPEPPAGWVVDRVRFEPVASGGSVTVEGEGAYRGAIDVAPAGGGLAVIDDVGLQDYLKGIEEVPPEWPTEALRAQAIAARTFVLNQRASTADSPWKAAGADICPTDSCQVYGGVAGEQRPSGERWTAAVDDTAGEVLLYKGEPLLAKYSASNGGRSVAGGQPYLRSVADPDDARSAVGQWQWAVPLAALAPVLGVAAPLVLTGVSRRGAVVVFATKAPDGTAVQHELGAEDFRARVNAALPGQAGLPTSLPSPTYDVQSDGRSAIFKGGGLGHGIGMSQYGALGKARRGLKADDILAAYYGGIRPVAIPADQLPATVKVAVALGRRSVMVSPDRYFKVVSGSGTQLGGVEVGRWRVEPAPGGVRVIPPEGRDQPLAVRTASVDSSPEAGTPMVRFDISAPAVVTVRYVTPSGLPGSVPAQVVDVGNVTQALPPPSGGGEYQVLIEADGGPGRFLSVPLTLKVAGPSRVRVGSIGAPSQLGGDGRPRRMAGLAAALVVAMGLGSIRTARRTGRYWR